MTIVEDAQKGIITDEMKIVAKDEGLDPEFILRGVAAGRIVIPTSPYRKVKICGIGEGLRTKVNASIGVSSDIVDVDMEINKAKAAEAAGADTLMELGTGGDFLAIRKKVIDSISLSVGSVPLYQAFIEAARKYGSIVHMTEKNSSRQLKIRQSSGPTSWQSIQELTISLWIDSKLMGGMVGSVLVAEHS